MGEPARKIYGKDPTRPDFDLSLIDGGAKGDGSSTPERDSVHELRDQEEGLWDNKTEPQERQYTGADGKKQRISKGKAGIFGKKKGPMALIAGGVLGGGSIIGLLFSPSLLIVQIKEMMVNKFNTQLASMDVRVSKKIALKINNTTAGMCNSTMSIACRYGTMSKKQIAKFEKAGIEVVDSDDILGRVRPKKFKYNGVEIDATQFKKMAVNDPEFRMALKKSYSSKFAGFADSTWKKVTGYIKLSKAKTKLDGDTDEEKLKDVQDTTKNGMDAEATSKYRVQDDGSGNKKVVDESGNEVMSEDGKTPKYSSDDIVDIESGAKNIDDFDKALKNSDNILEKEVAGNVDNLAEQSVSAAAGTVGSVLKVTGWFDNLCTVYNTVRAIGFAAKTVRALQLARYAMLFLNIADQIKSGDSPDPSDVEYLGNILTKEVVASATSIAIHSATDSFGYKYAAYGDRGALGNIGMQFLAGGGMTGQLIGITSKIGNSLGGSPKTTCRTLANPWVSAGSAVAGVALMLVPGVNVAMGVKDVVSAVGGAALVAANIFLPSLLKNIVAGNLIDKNTFGEKAMEAITSGSSGLMGTTAKFGGNSPMLKADAAAYSKLSNQIAAQYAEEDRLTHSPLDISNSNTFLGKIYMQLVPYMAKMTSPTNILSSVSSVVASTFSLALNLQSAKADTVDEYNSWCTDDEDYQSLGIATDPYCNVVYGIPPSALDKDPIEVINELGTEIDSVTGDPATGSNYESFMTDCINREDPLGYAGDSGTGTQDTDGTNCVFGKQYRGTDNTNYYLHYIDQRVESGMSGEDSVLEAATDFGYISFYDPVDNGTDTDINVASVDSEKVVDTINSDMASQIDTIFSTKAEPNGASIGDCSINDGQILEISSGYLCGYPSFVLVKKKEYVI